MSLHLSFRILVATELSIYKQVEKIISNFGKSKLFFSETSKEGYKILEQNEGLDLIIVDEFDGFYNNDLISNWADNKQWKNIPLILMTKEVTHLKLKIYQRHFIKHILIKPFSDREFFTKIENIFQLGNNFSESFLNTLRNIPFFNLFGIKDLYQIIELGKIRTFQVDEILIKKDGEINKFGVILEGEVGIYRVQNDERIIVANLGKGEFLGETNILTRTHSQTEVIAHQKTTVFMLPYFAFALLSEEVRDQLFRLIIIELSKKLRKTTADMVGFEKE